MLDLELWEQYVADLNCEPLFVTVSGAHLYGFESPDSDVDLRGAHRLPLEQVVGLAVGEETFERSGIHAGIEVDLVSHDVGKYFRLLVRNNGYVLEQIFSPLVVVGQDLLDYLAGVREQIAFADAHVVRWSIDAIEALFLPRTDPLPDEPSGVVKSYVRAHELESAVAAIVYPDRRGTGYGIARYEDHPRLDFSPLSEEPDVHFAHKSGFMCKTTATNPDRLRALIAGAQVDVT